MDCEHDSEQGFQVPSIRYGIEPALIHAPKPIPHIQEDLKISLILMGLEKMRWVWRR